MNILFLLSCLEPAGSETYCVALAKAWGERHRIFWISDKLHFGQTYTSYPIHQKAFPGGVANTWKVINYIRQNNIQVIHSHSRRAHWVAAQAAVFTGIPHVTTIHQPPPVHLFSRAFPCLGDHTIAIDEAVQDHLQKYFKRGIRKISLIRNGIEASPPNPSPGGRGENDNRILYIGRLTGGRWRALVFFLDSLKRFGSTLPKTCFQIVGRIPPERADELLALIKETNRAVAPSLVEPHDFVTDLPSFVAGARGVIAGGRSALESMAAGKPAIALGERGIIGLCQADTWADAMRTNLGDHIETKYGFYPAKLEVGLRDMLQSPARSEELGRWSRAQVETHYNIRDIAQKVDQVYQSCISRS